MEAHELSLEARSEAARDSANQWLARFVPLIQLSEAPTAPELRSLLRVLESLRLEAPTVRQTLFENRGVEDGPLLSTLDRSIDQLDSLEDDFRKRLGRLEPGDPQSLPDLNALQDRLAEREARQEIGVATDEEVPAVLEMDFKHSNTAAGVGMLTFGLGWTGFTLLHSIAMIGGMWMAFGPAALLLLLFYAIFYGVGFGMLWSAFTLMAKQRVVVRGFEMLYVRRLWGVQVRRKYVLGPQTRAQVEEVRSTMSNKNTNTTQPAVQFEDAEGRVHTVGQGLPRNQLERLAERINAYVAAQPA